MYMKMLPLIILISLTGPLLGAFIGVFRKYKKEQIYKMLIYASGVMIAISILQLVPESLRLGNYLIMLSGFIIGCFFMWALNMVVPHYHHGDHESKLKRAAFFLFVGIFIHNFPEGLAIGVGGIQNIGGSLLIALAIAIHDVPETICISAPLSRTLKNRHKAFWLALLSGVPTIVGFLVSYYLFKEIPAYYFSLIVSATAGIMVYISVVEIIWPIYIRKIKKSANSAYFAFGALSIVILQLLIK
jgi:ZIP family zinc transporter